MTLGVSSGGVADDEHRFSDDESHTRQTMTLGVSSGGSGDDEYGFSDDETHT
jgi:hypothetical protein